MTLDADTPTQITRPLLSHLFFVTLPVIALITTVTTIFILWETSKTNRLEALESENRLDHIYAGVFEDAISDNRMEDARRLAKRMIADAKIDYVGLSRNGIVLFSEGMNQDVSFLRHVELSPDHLLDDAQWVLTICSAVEPILTAVGIRFFRMGMFVIGSTALIILVFHMAIKSNILRPLSSLISSFLVLKSGDLQHRKLAPTYIQEIDELIFGYDRLLSRLDKDRTLNTRLFEAIEALSGVLFFDPEGNILASNHYALNALGKTDDGQDISDILTFLERIKQVAQEKDSAFHDWFMAEDGPTDFDLEIEGDRWFRFTRAHLAHGATICTLRDITERTQLKRQAEQDRRFKEIGRVGSGIAHDINNYLLAITGSVELALKEVPEDGEAARLLQSTLEQGDCAKRTTRQILGFLRDQSTEPEAFTPKVASEDLKRYLIARGAAPDCLTLHIETTRSLHVERVMFDRVLTNLVENSLHQAGDTTPELTLRFEDLVHSGGQSIQVTLQDNCGGFAPEIIELATEAFFTTKPQGTGTGLGLTMAKEFAFASGGDIHIANKDNGALVRLTLPSFDAATHVASPKEQLKEKLEFSGMDIVLVEDSKQNRLLMEKMLSQGGNRVTSFETLDGIRNAAWDKASPPDAIVSDFNLPDGNGRQAVELIRMAFDMDIPCLFVSGDGTQAALQHLAKNERLLLKPFSLSELREHVAGLVKYNAPKAA